MHVDTSRFPVVWLSSDGPSNWEPTLDGLLQGGERFVLLTRELPGRDQQASGDDRKRLAVWLKRNREQLSSVCAGSIVIVPNQAVALSLRVVLAPLARAFGYPVRLVTEQHLDDEIEGLLDRS